jgi:hypothetical protein
MRGSAIEKRFNRASIPEERYRRAMRLYADFNGLFREFLCLSHSDTCRDREGNIVPLCEGMQVIAYDEDADEAGNRDDLLAKGIVERSPEWLQCRGSRWGLRIDARGVIHESELESSERSGYE